MLCLLIKVRVVSRLLPQQYLFIYLRRGVGVSLPESHSFFKRRVGFPLRLGKIRVEIHFHLFIFYRSVIKYNIILLIEI